MADEPTSPAGSGVKAARALAEAGKEEDESKKVEEPSGDTKTATEKPAEAAKEEEKTATKEEEKTATKEEDKSSDEKAAKEDAADKTPTEEKNSKSEEKPSAEEKVDPTVIPIKDDVPAAISKAALFFDNAVLCKKKKLFCVFDGTDASGQLSYVLNEVRYVGADDGLHGSPWGKVRAELMKPLEALAKEMKRIEEAGGETDAASWKVKGIRFEGAKKAWEYKKTSWDTEYERMKVYYLKLLQEYDINKDGKVSADEAKQLIKAQTKTEEDIPDDCPALKWMVGDFEDVAKGFVNKNKDIQQQHKDLKVATETQKALFEAMKSDSAKCGVLSAELLEMIQGARSFLGGDGIIKAVEESTANVKAAKDTKAAEGDRLNALAKKLEEGCDEATFTEVMAELGCDEDAMDDFFGDD